MAGLDTPQWLIDTLSEKAHILRLGTWTFNVSLAMCVNENAHTLGSCHANPNINYASIIFRADIEDTDDWHEVIWHELIHVAHAPTDQAVESLIIPELDAAKQGLALGLYEAQVERYTDLLAKTLNALYPRRRDDDTEDDDEPADTE